MKKIVYNLANIFKKEYMRKFSIIIATDTQNGIGKDGKLAWDIPEDMKFFRETSSTVKKAHRQNAVIMGRKTWESIPEKNRPLSWRLNCILSSSYAAPVEKVAGNTYGFPDMESCQKFITKRKDLEKVFVIGGSYLYNLVLDEPCLDTIYLTQVFWDFDCDVFFSEIPYDFKEVSRSEKKTYKDITYQFITYKKKRSFLDKIFKKRCK